MDYFIVEASEPSLDSSFDCFGRWGQGFGLEGCSIGCVQFAGNETD